MKIRKRHLVEQLNELVQYEYTAAIQYQQHGLMVRGLWRPVLKGLFEESSRESFGHAKLLGEKIVALGGVPSVQSHKIEAPEGAEAMLRADLKLERDALNQLLKTINAAEADVPTRTLLEDQAVEEQEHVDELERILDQVQKAV